MFVCSLRLNDFGVVNLRLFGVVQEKTKKKLRYVSIDTHKKNVYQRLRMHEQPNERKTFWSGDCVRT